MEASDQVATVNAPGEPPQLLDVGASYATFGDLRDVIVKRAREQNFSLVTNKREKDKGSGLWRGKFTCSGSNTKQAKKLKTDLECTFCVPFSYVRADGTHIVKPFCIRDAVDGVGTEQQHLSLEHNHQMLGVLSVMSAEGELIKVKSLEQHLTEREKALIGLFAGTHVSVSDIQVLLHARLLIVRN